MLATKLRFVRLVSADGHEFFLDTCRHSLNTEETKRARDGEMERERERGRGSKKRRWQMCFMSFAKCPSLSQDRRIAYECDTFKKMVEKESSIL